MTGDDNEDDADDEPKLDLDVMRELTHKLSLATEVESEPEFRHYWRHVIEMIQTLEAERTTRKKLCDEMITLSEDLMNTKSRLEQACILIDRLATRHPDDTTCVQCGKPLGPDHPCPRILDKVSSLRGGD